MKWRDANGNQYLQIVRRGLNPPKKLAAKGIGGRCGDRVSMQRAEPRVEQISTYFMVGNDPMPVELYLVRGERNIIVDAGVVESPQRDILPRLLSLGLNLSDIDLILNTHGHFDHSGGNAGIKAASGAEVLIHKDDAGFLGSGAHMFELYFEPVIRAMGADPKVERSRFLEWLGPQIPPDGELKDGDVIDGGGDIRLRVVHLPGHSYGSTGFFWEKEGVLLCGDALVGLNVEGGKIPVIIDLPEYMKSLRRVEELPVRLLLCSHHYRGVNLPPSPVREGAEVNRYLDECRQFAEKLEEAAAAEARHASEKSFAEAADDVIKRLPAKMGFPPVIQAEKPVWFAQAIFFALKRLTG